MPSHTYEAKDEVGLLNQTRPLARCSILSGITCDMGPKDTYVNSHNFEVRQALNLKLDYLNYFEAMQEQRMAQHIIKKLS